MVKVPTPFTKVTCPVCRGQIDYRADQAALARHIGDKHPTAPKRQLARALFHKLNLSMPENIDEVSGKELDELLANLCKHEATKLGHKELRREIRGR